MNDATTPINFRELLNQPTDTAERPRKLPTGHYKGVIGNHSFDRSSKKQTAFVEVPVRVTEPTSDVDPVAVAGFDWSNIEVSRRFYITPKAMFMLADMLDAVLGKELGKSYDERLPNIRGANVIIGIVPRRNQDGTENEFGNDITTIVAA